MRDIRDLLREIDQTWTDPVQELTEAGVKGARNDMRNCPMARFIKANANPVIGLEVDGTTIWYENDQMQMFSFQNTAVTNFLFDFDRGLYPELVL